MRTEDSEKLRIAESAADQAHSTLMQAKSKFLLLEQEYTRTPTVQAYSQLVEANSQLFLQQQAYATSVANLFNLNSKLSAPLGQCFQKIAITAQYGGEGGGAGAPPAAGGAPEAPPPAAGGAATSILAAAAAEAPAAPAQGGGDAARLRGGDDYGLRKRK